MTFSQIEVAYDLWLTNWLKFYSTVAGSWLVQFCIIGLPLSFGVVALVMMVCKTLALITFFCILCAFHIILQLMCRTHAFSDMTFSPNGLAQLQCYTGRMSELICSGVSILPCGAFLGSWYDPVGVGWFLPFNFDASQIPQTLTCHGLSPCWTRISSRNTHCCSDCGRQSQVVGRKHFYESRPSPPPSNEHWVSCNVLELVLAALLLAVYLTKSRPGSARL